MASNPPFSRTKTSGNSISQWNGWIRCLPCRSDAAAAFNFSQSPCEVESQISTSARLFSRAFGLSAVKKDEITASPIERIGVCRPSKARWRASWMARIVSSGAD